jgi:hypothetical protein
MGLRVKITSGDTPAKIATLCDSPDPLPSSNLTINNRRVLQIQDFFRARYVKIFSRGNKVNRVSFDVVRDKDFNGKGFSGLLTAVAFAFDMGEAVPEIGLVEFFIRDGNATLTRWMDGGAIESVETFKIKGPTLWQRFTVIGGQFLTKNPNT